jgi:hypothetical protein
MLKTWLLVVAIAGVCGCGGDDGGEPLISGSVMGSYDGTSFDATFGFATPYQGGGLIGLGTGNLRCGSQDSSDPPTGRSAAISIPALEVGSYSSVFIQMFDNVGSFEGVGSNTGTVEITEVTDTSVSGSVSFDYTDDESREFTLSGTFEVINCTQ